MTFLPASSVVIVFWTRLGFFQRTLAQTASPVMVTSSAAQARLRPENKRPRPAAETSCASFSLQKNGGNGTTARNRRHFLR